MRENVNFGTFYKSSLISLKKNIKMPYKKYDDEQLLR